MTSRSIIIAELAFALALHDQLSGKIQNGRVKGQLKRIERIVVNHFKLFGTVPNSERHDAATLIKRFSDATGWDGKPLHIITKINFMLALYDTRGYARRLIEPLNEIYNYYARANDAPRASEWSAAMACEKWESIINNTREE